MTDRAAALARLSPERRRAVAAAWGLPADLAPADLAAALDDPFILNRRLARLTADQFAILDRLERSADPLPARQVAAALDRPFDEVAPDLRTLSDLFLIRRSPAALSPAPVDPADLPIDVRPEFRAVIPPALARRRPPGAE